MGSLMRMCADLGEHPSEMSLPTRVFLNVAADLWDRRAFVESADLSVPIRFAHDYLAMFAFASPQPETPMTKARMVRVGDSFVLNGPRGPVVIREAPEAP